MSAARPLVLITAGGTGGHVYPALAVAQELLGRGYRVEWVGTRAGLEHRVVPEAGITLHCLPVRGIRGKSVLHKLGAAFILLAGSAGALWLVLRRSPGCVVGMGGYAAGPAGMAAWLLRKPLLIHEQNAVAGTTNRMLARFARRILCAFPAAFSDREDVEVIGNPLRRELVEAGAAASYDYDGRRPLRLLVLGGSLGARAINEVVPRMLRRMARGGDHDWEVWHQTGETHIDDMRVAYRDLAPESVNVAPFIEDMASAYAWADLVLCRAGALTVSELAVMGRPAILVPLPHAIDDHQAANARSLTSRGAGIMLLQTQLDAYMLGNMVRDLRSHPERLAAMARAASEVALPDAAVRASDCCEELMHA